MLIKLNISFPNNSTNIALSNYPYFKSISVKEILSSTLNGVLETDIKGLNIAGLINRPHTFNTYTTTNTHIIGLNYVSFYLYNFDGTISTNIGDIFILLNIE